MSFPHQDDDREPSSRPVIAVVCLCDQVGSGLELTLDSLLAHTDAGVPVVVAGGGEAARAIVAASGPRGGGRIVWRLNSADIDALAHDLAPSDIAVVRPPCRVAAGWLGGLRVTAGADAGLALVAALGEADDSAGGDDPAGDGGFAARAAARAAGAGHLGARIPAHVPVCCLIRRSAIDLVGAADLAAGFIRRAERAGLASIVAENVLVVSGASPPPADNQLALARAIGSARRARDGVAVVIDARCLSGPRDGTRTHVLGLLRALALTAGIGLTALIPEDLDAETEAEIDAGPGYRRVRVPAAGPIPAGVRGDVVHRPFQIDAHADVSALGRIADRLVITHQDLISFHQREYFPTREAWLGYRAMTRSVLRVADHVVFFSGHVLADALAEDLVETARASVVPLGVDQASVASDGARALPASGEETILCLGTDFAHKNRMFALRIVQALQLEHDWDGRLVLAGPAMRWGTSRDAEAEFLAAEPRLRDAVLDAGEVSAADRARLLDGADLVLYPTVHEGFGLIPFESAVHGRPCLWAAGSALAELLPVAAARIVPWDPSATAEAALALMRDPGSRDANVTALQEAAAALTWEGAARSLASLYARVCDAPPAPAASLEREHGLVGTGLSEDAVRLVGPGGALPPDLERPVLALVMHSRFARPLFATLRVGYRVGHELGRRRRADELPPRNGK